MPKGFRKTGSHNSISSEEDENVNMPGKDPKTDVETLQKEKTKGCDWPCDHAEKIENSEDLAFSSHYKLTKRNKEKQIEKKKQKLLSGKVPRYPSIGKNTKQMKTIWMKLMMFHQTVLLILRMMTFKNLKHKL